MDPQKIKVAHLCPNDPFPDSRIRKVVLTSQAAGFDTSVYAIARENSPNLEQHELDGNPLTILRSFDAEAVPWVRTAIKKNRLKHFGRYQNMQSQRAGRNNIKAAKGSGKLSPTLRARIRLHKYRSRHREQYFNRKDEIRRQRAGEVLPSSLVELGATAVEYSMQLVDEVVAGGPDIIHIHDLPALYAAIEIRDRLVADGHSAKLLLDLHEWYPGVLRLKQHLREGYLALLDEYLPQVDAVLTVSPIISELVQKRYSLDYTPPVVANSPLIDPTATHETIHQTLDLDPETPLMVYLGRPAPARGLATVLEAMPSLPDMHFALVSPETPYTRELAAHAKTLGVERRFHQTPYVDPELIVPFVSSATVGLSPALHTPNHELALGTKIQEYAGANVPVVLSDLLIQEWFLSRSGIGEVYEIGNVEQFVDSVKKVVSQHDHYKDESVKNRDFISGFEWRNQSAVIPELYKLLDEDQDLGRANISSSYWDGSPGYTEWVDVCTKRGSQAPLGSI